MLHPGAGKLARPETRTGYKRKFKQLIWALLNNGAIPDSAILEILSTKLDKLAPKPGKVPVVDEVEEFEGAIVQEFAADGRAIALRHICAYRDRTSKSVLSGSKNYSKPGWSLGQSRTSGPWPGSIRRVGRQNASS
ncbi:hypothetical protein EB234_30265 [Mesorhizobium japonicum R7A]|uniref:Uncharacterized protein n=4 Tax=Mesorhizobium TaxID=68287 RepID=Q8KGQ1_RHILI|nr:MULTISPECIES: hypothetical protein [Mesorhizobium]QGX80629.1 hypothetical protein EB234_30265 [Mesorhizobium japonicum R7A]QJF04776.1 hypothetical protein R7A2020_29870 [Mesorhizobium japonicum R7A]QJF10845.1 hypothetical protein HID05_29860 [Mesorhizobium japonicum]QJI86718.1 hypothetical protein HKB46_29870 [Mesorhizobium japonicum]QKD05744.1 hypothetical protein EB235_33325 [Mesorhizobium loti R88b]